jgi:hypothetical protein
MPEELCFERSANRSQYSKQRARRKTNVRVSSATNAISKRSYSEIKANVMPKRAMLHIVPVSQTCRPGASDRHVGRRATIIRSQPTVMSQRTHNVMEKRVAI